MPKIEVLSPGIQATVQDPSGREGLLDRGFFPSGAMDPVSLRIGNLAVGNPLEEAGIEITFGKAAFHFPEGAVVAVTGAPSAVTIDGDVVEMGAQHEIPPGGVLRIGAADSVGFRQYLAVQGGIDVPKVFGSRSTYTMGGIGGHEGRALRKGDVLAIGELSEVRHAVRIEQPEYTHDWELDVVPGPHAGTDYLTPADADVIFGSWWTVDRNSNRTGIRLEPRVLTWSRADGGIAGSHPSNILDVGYPVGGVNLNGDTPVLLAPDGPTSGGFVVVAVIATSSMWKLGQLRPGTDRVRLKPVDFDTALTRSAELADRFTSADARAERGIGVQR